MLAPAPPPRGGRTGLDGSCPGAGSAQTTVPPPRISMFAEKSTRSGWGKTQPGAIIRAPQGPIWEDALVRPLAIGALGALHRARAVLPAPQGCDRCSRIRKPECERLACKAAPSCGVLALARPSTSPIRRDRRVGYPNTKLRELRAARRRPQRSLIRSPCSALWVLQAEHLGLVIICENLRISGPIYHRVERFLGRRVAEIIL